MNLVARMLLACIVACLAAPSAHALKAQWKDLNAQAETQFGKGEFDKALASAQQALAVAEETAGPESVEAATSLNAMAYVHLTQGRNAEAEPLFLRAIAIREKLGGPESTDVADTLTSLGLVYQAQNKLSSAEATFLRTLKIREETLGPTHADVAQSLGALAGLHDVQGRYAEGESLYVRALAIQEKALGPDGAELVPILSNMAVLYDHAGKYALAEAAYLRAIAITEKTGTLESTNGGAILINLGLLYKKQAKYAQAEPLYQRALASLERLLGPEHLSVAQVINNLGMLYVDAGRYAQAEPMLQRSLAMREKLLGLEHPAVAVSLNNLGGLYMDRGQYAQSEPLYQRSLAVREKALGAEHALTGQSLGNLAGLYAKQRRQAEAEPLMRRALAINEKKLGAEHPQMASSLRHLGDFYLQQQRYPEAEPLFRRALAIDEKAFGPEHPDVARNLLHLGELERLQHRYAQGEPLLNRAVAIEEIAFGPDHPELAAALSKLAQLQLDQGHDAAALSNSSKATAILRRRFTRGEAGGGDESALAEQKMSRDVFLIQLRALDRAQADGNDKAVFAAEGFEVAQLARASSVGQSVAQMAARFARRGDPLAAILREQQDLRDDLVRAEKSLLAAVSKSPDKRDAAAEDTLRQSIADLGRQLEQRNLAVASGYPAYQALTSQEPVAAASARQLLRAEEALLVYSIGEDRSYAWVLRRDRIDFLPLAIGRKDLDTQVQFLRGKLAPDQSGQLPVMTPATSARLYGLVFEPLEPALAGVKHVIVVPEGALQSLPFGLLGDRHKDTAAQDWLARRYAFSVLPSVGAFRALRSLRHGKPGKAPFAGFGDPLLEGDSSGQRSLAMGQVFLTRSMTASSAGAASGIADVNVLRKSPPLPDTGRELKALSKALKGSPDALYLQAQATESQVKKLDLSGYRFIAFSTHGVMAGELDGVAEPGLVLTPPAAGSELDDGYLSASEVAQLKLGADWVLLSACNTSAPDGTPGAEGLSGLAKAFFHAGSRALLVSSWPVASDATAHLVIDTMTAYSRKPRRGKAAALQQAMLAMMDRPATAHPFFWAPFSAVGD